MLIKSFIKRVAPESVIKFLRDIRGHFSNQRYFQQGFTHIKCGDYEIEAPDKHILTEILKSQPYRDLCIGITAQYISAKYPKGTIIDIGANIGDTAAIIATYAQNKLILVEGSDYFFDILVRNSSQFPNETVLKKILISDGSTVSGFFRYCGGSAVFHERSVAKEQIQTERLSNIADENTCFIKTDIDGYDFKILTDSLEWLSEVHPAILFENYILNNQDYNSANELFVRLMEIGYAYFIIWDDPGFYLLSTTSIDILKDLNRYLYKVHQSNGLNKRINNYDVLCLHENDEDVYQNICEWYKTY